MLHSDLDDILARYELLTEADVFKEILKELRGSGVLDGLRPQDHLRSRHVVVESTDLRIWREMTARHLDIVEHCITAV